MNGSEVSSSGIVPRPSKPSPGLPGGPQPLWIRYLKKSDPLSRRSKARDGRPLESNLSDGGTRCVLPVVRVRGCSLSWCSCWWFLCLWCDDSSIFSCWESISAPTFTISYRHISANLGGVSCRSAQLRRCCQQQANDTTAYVGTCTSIRGICSGSRRRLPAGTAHTARCRDC